MRPIIKAIKKARQKAILLLGLPGLLSCACLESVGPGTFGVVFAWEGGQPALLGDEYVWAAVEERENPQTAGRVLGSVGPQPFFMDSELKFLDIPNGDNRVVIVEIRDGQGASANVLYYGISERFSLEPGKHAQVEVYMRLRAVPGDTEGWVFIEAIGEMINHTDVKLVLLTDTGVKAKVSHFVSFPPEKTVETDLSDLESYPDAPPDLSGYRMDWDLAWEPVYACEDEDYCPRRVFVRLVDGQGYESKTVYADAILDLTPPAIMPGTVSRKLVPGDDLLDDITSAKAGTTVKLFFTMSEPLRADPIVQTTAPAALKFGFAGRAGTSYEYIYQLRQPLPPDGTYTVQISAVDKAGNPTTPDPTPQEAEFMVDTQVPPAPDVDAYQLIVYKRTPWGPGSIFTIEAGPGAVEAEAWALFYNDARQEIDRVQADVTGGFGPHELAQADRPEVYVGAVDGAGNQSPVTLVRDVEWTATFGGSSRLWFEERTWFGRPLFHAHGYAETDLQNLAGRDGNLEDTAGGARGWTQWLKLAEGPTARQSQVMSYDSARGRMVMFGGSDGTYNAQTWEWDGRQWILRCGTGTYCSGPPALATPAMAYDGTRGVTVLFGGDSGSSEAFYGDTWEWDGDEWRLACAEGDSCAGGLTGRWGHHMVYDRERGRVVMFGGCKKFDPATYACTDFSNETWEWDGGEWTQVCGSGTGCSGPSGRLALSMTFDGTDGVVILHGGCTTFTGGSCSARSDETWAFDGSTWKKVCGSGTACGAPTIDRHGLAFDASRDRVVLFGGRESTGYSGKTWEWNGSNWSMICDTMAGCNGPSRRARHSMAFDPVKSRVVSFGGSWGWPNFSEEVWEWDGRAWRIQYSADVALAFPAPADRRHHAMAYDSGRERTVLFGGSDTASFDDTWEFDGERWKKACGTGTTCTGPTARRMHAMAYDAVTKTVVMFGGFDDAGLSDQLWEWNGTSWKQACGVPTSCSGPVARYGHSMMWDGNQQRIVVFGGCVAGNGSTCTTDSDEVWEWSGSNRRWTRVCGSGTGCSGPSARNAHKMVYDDSRNVGVMFGGCTSWGVGYCNTPSDEVWEWNGSQWRRVCGTGTACSGPTTLADFAMTYDSGRGVAVIHSGVDGNIIYFDTWEWNGSSWNMLCGAGINCLGPPARYQHAMTYDPDRGQAVMFGGRYLANNNETWLWDGGATSRPGQVIAVPFAQALDLRTAPRPDPLLCLRRPSECPVREVAVDWLAGGEGDDSQNPGTLVNGTELLAWSQNEWIRLSGNGAGTGSPAAIHFDLTTGDPPNETVAKEIGRLFFGDLLNFYLAVTPTTDSKTLPAFGQVATDFLSVTVKYRLDHFDL
jgi:hypothetical protein